jgi:hypothetical protein
VWLLFAGGRKIEGTALAALCEESDDEILDPTTSNPPCSGMDGDVSGLITLDCGVIVKDRGENDEIGTELGRPGNLFAVSVDDKAES